MEKIVLDINSSVKFFLQNEIKNNLLGIILFGSGNNDDFNNFNSDLDYFIVIENVNLKCLKTIEKTRLSLIKKFNKKIDMKVISKKEILNAKEKLTSSEFFNGWGVYAILNKKQKIIYGEEYILNLCSNFDIDIKRFSLERLSYYIHKLRKILVSDYHLLHNVTTKLNSQDKNKVLVSCFKNIFIFTFASKGIFVYSNEEIIENIENVKIKNLLEQLFENKKKIN